MLAQYNYLIFAHLDFSKTININKLHYTGFSSIQMSGLIHYISARIVAEVAVAVIQSPVYAVMPSTSALPPLARTV